MNLLGCFVEVLLPLLLAALVRLLQHTFLSLPRVSCLCVGAGGPQGGPPGVSSSLAFAFGGSLEVGRRPWGTAGGPPRGGPSRLCAADSRVPSGAYERLRRLINRKQQEVQQLQETHASLNDPLQLRQHYVSHRHNAKLIEKLRVRLNPGSLQRSIQIQFAASRDPNKQQQLVQQQQQLLKRIREHGQQQPHQHQQQHQHQQHQQQQEQQQQQQQHQQQEASEVSAEECMDALAREDPDETSLAVVCEVKRSSKITSKGSPDRLAFKDAADVVLPLSEAGADVLLVATDSEAWGGTLLDLQRAAEVLKERYKFAERPALVMKDLIIHPIQIAQAAEAGADGVYLVHSVVGGALEELLFTACTAGIEALVEVHGAGEARQAVASGATLLVANQADRLTGLLYPYSAGEVRDAVSPEIIVAAKGGLKSPKEAKHLARCGIDAVVLGRALMQDEAFQLVREMKGIKAGPRSLVHLFAGVEAAAEALRKTQEEEKEARQERRRAAKREGSPHEELLMSEGSVSKESPSPAALAALCASPAAGGTEGLLEGLPDGPEAADGLAATAAKEGYNNIPTGGRGGAPGGPPDAVLAPSFLSPFSVQQKGDGGDIAALDASLKTRVVRVSAVAEGGDSPAGAPRGLQVYHSFDFNKGPGTEPPKASPGGAPASRDSSSNACSSTAGSPAEGDLSDAALQDACKEILIAASERPLDGEEGETDEETLPLPIAQGVAASAGAPSAAPATHSELLPRKVYRHHASGEVEEVVIDPLAATVKGLDPKLVASLVEEARANPKAFAAAAEQQIVQTWKQAEELEALNRGDPLHASPTTETVSTAATPEALSKLPDVPLLESLRKPAEGEEAEAPWAPAAALPVASKEEMQGWLNDLELQRTAHFFLSPEEVKDFFGRIRTASKEVGDPAGVGGPSLRSEEVGTPAGVGGPSLLGPGHPKAPASHAEPKESLLREWRPLQQEDSQAPIERHSFTDTKTNATADRAVSSEGTTPSDSLHTKELLLPPKEPAGTAGTSPGPAFSAAEAPVTFGEWLLKPRGGQMTREEPMAKEREAQTTATFSRVGCVEAKRPLASVYDHMEPYMQYFQPHQLPQKQKTQQQQHCGSCQDDPRPASKMQPEDSLLDRPIEFDEEALRELLPPPEAAPQRSMVDEWADSGGIELGGPRD